jgi:hypothetical protein
VWNAERAEDVIAAQARCRAVVKRGRITVEREEIVHDTWRERRPGA